MSYVMKGDKLTEVTASDALLREALDAVMNTRHSPWIGGSGVFQCACVVHENARAALAATPPASATMSTEAERPDAARDALGTRVIEGSTPSGAQPTPPASAVREAVVEAAKTHCASIGEFSESDEEEALCEAVERLRAAEARDRG